MGQPSRSAVCSHAEERDDWIRIAQGVGTSGKMGTTVGKARGVGGGVDVGVTLGISLAVTLGRGIGVSGIRVDVGGRLSEDTISDMFRGKVTRGFCAFIVGATWADCSPPVRHMTPPSNIMRKAAAPIIRNLFEFMADNKDGYRISGLDALAKACSNSGIEVYRAEGSGCKQVLIIV